MQCASVQNETPAQYFYTSDDGDPQWTQLSTAALSSRNEFWTETRKIFKIHNNPSQQAVQHIQLLFLLKNYPF